MSRPLRIEYENAWYHVMNRGIARQDIYHTAEHRKIFLVLLEEIFKKFHIEIHSYCLMDNHYHLLVRTPLPNLGKAMRHLDGVYTRRFNILQKRDGPIFRGRYHAILIEEENYLLRVSRYIHLNPVAAKISDTPYRHPWSSYSYFIGRGNCPNWLIIERILSHLGSNSMTYAEFVAEGVEDDLDKFYQTSRSILGSDTFVSEHLKKLNDSQKIFCSPDINRFKKVYPVDSLINIIKNYFCVEIGELKNNKQGRANLPRSLAMFFIRQYTKLTHQEITKYFSNIHPRSIGRLLNRIETQINNDQVVRSHMKNIDKLINQVVVDDT